MSSCQLQLLIGALKRYKKTIFHTLLTMVVKIQMEHQYTKMRIFIFDLKFEHIFLLELSQSSNIFIIKKIIYLEY